MLTLLAVAEPIPASHLDKGADVERLPMRADGEDYDQARQALAEAVPPGWRLLYVRRDLGGPHDSSGV